jgi:phospholipid transport system substrate-binding protein
MKTLSDKSISLEDKRKIIEKIALENVDINAIGKYTLGDFRKTLDDSNSRKYDDLFEKYFLKSLTSRLTDYSNNKFEIISAEQKSSKYTIVKSKISESSSQPEIQIDWRVYTKDPLKPLIRDLVVEGLSLARTQKEEFSSILSANNNDVNFLFARLEKFIAN